MASAGNYNFPEDTREDRIIKDLIKRIEALERGTSLGSSAIDRGAVTVTEGAEPRVKMGKLDDGSYGLAVYDDAGVAFPLSQLAFGLKADRADSSITPPRNVWTLDTDLSTTVEIRSGRMIVIVSARIYAGSGGQGTPTSGTYAWQAQGPTPITANIGQALYVRYAGSGQDNILQASWVDVQEGLENGTYVITPYMLNDSVASPANDTSFSYRRLLVIPY
jgi:hypothetical protein